MHPTINLLILITGAILAALAAIAGIVGAVQLTSRRAHGYLHLIFYAIVLMVALGTLVSSRDLSVLSLNLESAPSGPRHPLIKWSQPLVSLLLLTVAGERIISYWIKRDNPASASPALLLSFIVFWLCTVAASAFFGAHPYVSHDYAYPLVIGIAAALTTGTERDMALKAARNALLVFMLAGLVLMALKPGMALESTYTQGLFSGVPRLAGLAAHAVSLGMLAQLGLVCLLALPYRQAWLNRLAWAVGLGVLFMAQSKTAWVSFILCWLCFMAVREGRNVWRRLGDPMRPEFGVVSIVVFMIAVMGVGMVLMFGDLGSRIDAFFNTAEGAQLASLTGRDKIWAIAFDEWRRNPVFGYGPLIWETDFRLSIGMANATHAHNQFMDTLSRSGTVGAVALLFYASVLMFMSFRYARESKGLTLALFVMLAMRSISEVPLSLFGYGPEFLTHLLLLMALAAVASDVRSRKTRAVQDARRFAVPAASAPDSPSSSSPPSRFPSSSPSPYPARNRLAVAK